MEPNKDFLHIAFFRAEAQLRIEKIKQTLLDISSSPTDAEILALIKEWRELRVKVGIFSRELPPSFYINPNDD